MSVANLKTNLNGLMLDGVCERGAAGPGNTTPPCRPR